jgi:7-cyano-7-deazaguanine synthase in queuosine biosynthesis
MRREAMNPLIESCIEITRAGIEKRDEVDFKYNNQRLQSLGNFLLDNSNLDRTFHLRPGPRSTDKVAIMFGGGIDSYIAMFYALSTKLDTSLIHVDYGQPYVMEEREVYRALFYARQGSNNVFGKDINTLKDRYKVYTNTKLSVHMRDIQLMYADELSDIGNRDYVIPARNLALAAIGTEYADRVWIVSNKRTDETVGTPDKTSRFYRESSALFSDFYEKRITVESPFFRLSKLEAVRAYLESGGNVECLKATWSCYTPVRDIVNGFSFPCGTCYSCFKRFKLFQALNIEYNFDVHPQKGPHWSEFEERERRKGR